MDIAVLYSPLYKEHVYLIDAAQKIFSKVLAVPLDGVSFTIKNSDIQMKYRNTDLFSFDVLFPRFFSEDLPLMEALSSIAGSRFPNIYLPIDEDSFSITSHKFYTMKILAEAGLPIPQSVFTVAHRDAFVGAEELGYPVVVKLSSRTGGKGVLRASSPSDLVPILDTLELFERDLSLQSFIKNPGEDVRVLVIGDETYSYKRIGPPGEWRSNIHGGGRREK